MTAAPCIERVVAALPGGFEALRAEAASAGYRHLDRLATEWDAGRNRFDRDGEALLAAFADDVLVAIGGLTVDPVEAGALRMRRFYVAKAQRRQGIGRILAIRLLRSARDRGRRVTVNAATGSAPFWEALGFAPDARDGHTHAFGAADAD